MDASNSTWYGGRPQPRRLCVRLGPSYPRIKGTPTPPNFWPMSIVAKRLDASRCPLIGMEVGLSPGDFVLDGDPAPYPLPEKGRSPAQFSAHVYCGQTAAWIKMPLGTEVGLGLRDIVFDVDPATPRKRAHPHHPIFGPCLVWPNGWMDEDDAWYGNRPRPRPHCTRRVPAPAKGAQQPPLFGHVYCGHGRPCQLLLSSCYVRFG